MLQPQTAEKKKSSFVDGDVFYRIDTNMLHQLDSLLASVEEDAPCPQCKKRSNKIKAKFCEYCGFQNEIDKE